MYHMNRGRLKSYILLTLLVTGLLQVGILLNYQNHGFPINFFTAIFSNVNNSISLGDNASKKEYFVPYRIVASNGNQYHWLIDKNDNSYAEFWNEAKSYLKNALASQPIDSSPADKEWRNLVEKKGIFFEFKSNISINLAKWFLGIQNAPNGEPTGIYKIIIIPGYEAGDGISAIYINDGSTVYRYITLLGTKGMTGESFDNRLVEMEEDKKNYELKKYMVLKELDSQGRLPFTYSPDILCIVGGPKFRDYRNANSSIPDKISKLNQDEIANIILENEKQSYDRSLDFNNTIVFKNQDNVYRIYSNGLLEYKYIAGNDDSGKYDAGAAFINAAEFINRLKKYMISGVDIYLSGISTGQDKNSFKYTFDYKIGDIPVVMNLESEGNDKKPVNNAIVIEANSKRIMECRWMMKSFEQSSKISKFNARMDSLNTKLENYSKLFIKDLYVSYVIGSDKEEILEPLWVIEKDDGEKYVIPMVGEKGD